VIDVLKQELSEVRTKSRLVDDWIFRSLSIAYIPFLALVIYPYANKEYRVAFLAVPFLSLLGALLHSIFINHYMFCHHYGKYLQRRLNESLGGDYIQDSQFGDIFYLSKSSIASLTSVLAFIVILMINIALIPVINIVIATIRAQHPTMPRLVSFGLEYYWPLNIALFVCILSVLAYGALSSLRRLKSLPVTNQEK
jgi:hypothetical protein